MGSWSEALPPLPAYRLIRSRRRTIGLEVRDGALLVRAPQRAARREIEETVLRHRDWIEAQLARDKARREAAAAQGLLSEAELAALKAQAAEAIPARVAHYAQLMGVTCGQIRIGCQRTRWGSCTADGNLRFNCLLMLAPPEVLDSVVAHEVCHRLEMNHSARFYAEVLRVYPDYPKWRRWLRENGPVLLRRVPQRKSGQEERKR